MLMHNIGALSAITFAAGANAVVRGVNLGGWLVLEPWYVFTRMQSE
jgi:hypothetical protein